VGKKQLAEQKKRNKEAKIRNKEEKKKLAITKTKKAQKAINQLESILLHTLKIDDVINWNNLLSKKQYPVQRPVKKYLTKKPVKPNFAFIRPEPNISDTNYQLNIGILDKLFPKLKNKKEEEAENRFISDHKIWKKRKHQVDQQNKKLEDNYTERVKKWEIGKLKHDENHEKTIKNWELSKLKYKERQEKTNKKILEKKSQYLNKKEPDAISDYCEMVLANSKYPDYFPQEWDIDYQANTKILIVDYSLPNINSLPTVKAVKYIISKDEFTKTNLSNTALNKLYDGLLYQISLRTIHELYEADVINSINSVVFNGWVNSIDKATGHNINSCVMSLQVAKDEFLVINLAKIDPKICFKQLKGVASTKLHGLSPIAPIISIDKEDRRFVSGYDVVNGMDESDNLATMDWQDFENLIREIFEKKFISSGGEVKITQASRDGGVDAVAFDPDPIRGGKIVIQAKRYTNVVGVSAVRDLFGTTVNEGATKGILVTTADYGPDAYEFAKGKPLTLLNGSNLLHLLEKHGHRAKIDIKEAKKYFAEQKKNNNRMYSDS